MSKQAEACHSASQAACTHPLLGMFCVLALILGATLIMLVAAHLTTKAEDRNR